MRWELVLEDRQRRFEELLQDCINGDLDKIGKNGADCYSKNGHAVTVLTRQS